MEPLVAREQVIIPPPLIINNDNKIKNIIMKKYIIKPLQAREKVMTPLIIKNKK